MLKLRKKWAAGMAAVSMAALMAWGCSTPVMAQSNENAEQSNDQVVVVEETAMETTADGNEEGENSENASGDRDVSGALTPNGNLTLVDDLDEEASKEMQFMTVTTRDGSYYYIVIDRSGNSENVYFLNAVDTADLMNLMSEDEKAQFEENNQSEPESVITPEVNIGEEEENPPAEQEAETGKENRINTALPTLGVFAGIGVLIAGAYYMLKIRPKKNRADIDEDREFYDDDEYENEDEADEKAETKDEADEKIESETEEEK